MVIDFSKAITNLDGTPLKQGDGREDKVADLRYCCIEALLSMDPKEQIAGEKKLQRYSLAKKIYNATEPLELKVEDVALIKELVGKGYGVGVVGPVFELIEASK